ncbi:MAG: hypothetical protein ACKVW3_03010 [Phycisphaerales bacterium]
MDRFKKILDGISANLGGMSGTQKLLIGSLAVILLMTLFLVSQYAGKTTMVPLWPSAPPEDQARAKTTLQTAQVSFEERADGIYVPVEQRDRMVAVLAQSGQQPANAAIVYENILKTQSWMNTKEQNRQISKIMLDNWLSSVLSKFDGIQDARVFVDAPEPFGVGQAVRSPKASITLFTTPGRTLPQSTVDAAARMVAGSVAGLELARVAVTDGSTGKPRKAANDDEMMASVPRDTAKAIERDWKAKIENLLANIEGLAVEVTATVDASRTRAQVMKNLPTGEGTVAVPKKETNSSVLKTEAAPGAEPGIRSNQGADLNQTSAVGSKTETKDEETEFTVGIGTRNEQIDDPGGRIKSLAATVNIPRSFITGLIERERAAAADPKAKDKPPAPTDGEIRQRFDAERTSIEAQLKPHFKVETPQGPVQGEVVVSMMSSDIPGLMRSGSGGGGVSGFGGSGMGSILALNGSGLVDKVLLAGLAVVALMMMLLLARRASRRVELPSAEELIGAPPALETGSEVVGEADDAETAMAGIEVRDEDLRATKLREQVGSFIRSNPDLSGKLLNRWVSVEE